MLRPSFLILISTFVILPLLLPALTAHSQPSPATRPNIVLILADDLGWSDLGSYGNDIIQTPHIDSLAAAGLRFTNFYASTPVCSSTRIAIQSGQHPARTGLTNFIPSHWRPFEKLLEPPIPLAMPLETVTLGELLRDAGYTTAYFGKWHLGWGREYQPDHQGYDYTVVTGGPYLPGRYRASLKVATDTDPAPDEYRTDYEARLGVEFIRRAAPSQRPFFLTLSPGAVHIPLEAKPETAEKYNRLIPPDRPTPHPVYAAMVEHLDDLVGSIVAALEQAGIADRTLLIFTSDNGGLHRVYTGNGLPVTDNAPLRGEKGSLHEGGIRVPLIVHWPGVTPPGSTTDAPAVTHDLLPTLARIAGAALPADQPLDGIAIDETFRQPAAAPPDRTLYFHYPHYHHSRPASALREGNLKLIHFFDDDSLELYDLAADLSETTNLAESQPDLAARLKRDLDAWRSSVSAQLPRPNPAHQPDRAHEWWSRSTIEPVNLEDLQRLFDQAVRVRP